MGSLVRFPNGDDTRHHVYSFSEAKTFELQLYRSDDAPPIEFDRTGLVVLGCNIHDGMTGFIYVVDSEHYGVTDSGGQLTLPPLTYGEGSRLMLWHPQMTEAMEVDLDGRLAQSGDLLTLVLPFTYVEPSTEPQGSGLRNRLQRFKSSGD